MAATGRYTFIPLIRGGRSTATSYASTSIRAAILRGDISYNTTVVEGQQRLDTIAATVYGDSSLWWVIAAASGIGWALQMPPGTLLYVPNNLAQVYAFLN